MSDRSNILNNEASSEESGSSGCGNCFWSIISFIQELCCCTQPLPLDVSQSRRTTTSNEAFGEAIRRQPTSTSFRENDRVRRNLHNDNSFRTTVPKFSINQNHNLSIERKHDNLPKVHRQIRANLLMKDKENVNDLEYNDGVQTQIQDLGLKKRKEQQASTSKDNQQFPLATKSLNIVDDLDDESDGINKTAESYRDEARNHLRKKQQLLEKAKQSKRIGNHRLANYFFKQAAEKQKLQEQANNLAAVSYFEQNRKRNPNKNTIDLHHLYVSEATRYLDIFLDEWISEIQSSESTTDSKLLLVITGRGKHSTGGIPKVKPAVIKRLKERRLEYFELNPGSLKVEVSKESLLSNHITG